MSEHVLGWIAGYHDGELTESRRAEVEAHLGACAECRSELEELRALSGLLETFEERPSSDLPVERSRTSREFGKQVMARLPERQVPRRERWLKWGWKLAPVGLFGVWAFFQAALWLAGGLRLAAGWIPGAAELVQSLAPLEGLMGRLPGGWMRGLLGSIPGLDGGLGWTPPVDVLELGLSAVIGILLLSWWTGEVLRRREVREKHKQ